MFRPFGMDEFWFIVLAVRWTLALSAVAFAGGAVGGLLIALARVGKIAPLRYFALGYIRLFQGTPLLMQLFLVFFGLNIFGVSISPWIAAAIALTLHASAFLGEIWRGCIQAVPKQQWEASESLALTRAQQYRYVILPQAIRISLPPTVGFAVQVVKNTSIASIIGFVELARAGQLINNATFQPFRVFVAVAVLYFIVCYPLSQLSRWLERRLHAGSNR